jgi:hypothetical protein
VPDLDVLAEGIRESLAELQALVPTARKRKATRAATQPMPTS